MSDEARAGAAKGSRSKQLDTTRQQWQQQRQPLTHFFSAGPPSSVSTARRDGFITGTSA